jgi:FkbM family methyltransferase
MDQIDAFHRLIEAGDTIMDVGGFRGHVSTQFAQMTGPAGSVYTFEPHPLHFAELSMLASVLDCEHSLNVYPNCKAISDRVGHLYLHISRFTEDSQFNQASSTAPELANIERLGQDFTKMRVECTTLDQYCSEHLILPSFIKIDCEGADWRVIFGATHVIQKVRPIITTEFGFDPNNDLPTNILKHLELLESHQYETYLIDVMSYNQEWTKPGSRFISPEIHRFGPKDARALKSAILGNILAMPRESKRAQKIAPFISRLSALDFLG